MHERRGPPPPWWLLGGDGGGGGGGLAFLLLPSYDALRLSRLLVGRGGSWCDLLLCPVALFIVAGLRRVVADDDAALLWWGHIRTMVSLVIFAMSGRSGRWRWATRSGFFSMVGGYGDGILPVACIPPSSFWRTRLGPNIKRISVPWRFVLARLAERWVRLKPLRGG